MTRAGAKNVMEYYGGIQTMIKLLKAERAEIEIQNYNALGAAADDGLPHSGQPGKPVESMAITAAENGAGERMREIDEKVEIMTADYAAIRGCLDGLHGRYKQILAMRYLHRYSWGKISVRMETPDSTARAWHDKALSALGTALEDVPGIGEILGRASRARV